MAEKILNTRLQLKIDTYANWTKLDVPGQYGNLILKKGEIGICEIPAENAAATTAPTVLFKVGDGTLPYHNADPTKCLKWASALAADVYAWAKQTTLSTNTESSTSTSGDKTYTGNAITSVSWDSTLNGGKGGLKFVKGTQFATKAELDAALEAFGGDIASITDNDTRYTFAIPASGDNAGKLAITETKYVNGKAEGSGTTTYYDFVTPAELARALTGYVKSVDKVANTAITVTNTDAQNPKIGLALDDAAASTGKTKVELSQSNNGLKAEIDLSDYVKSADMPKLQTGNGVNVDTNDNGKTYTFSHADISNAVEGDHSGIETDQFGHVVGVDLSAKADKSVVDGMYTNAQIDNLIQGAKKYADDNDANDNTEYHVEYDSVNKKIKLVAGADASKMEIPTDDFIKDGMISSVEIKDKNLVITWNTDAEKTETKIPLTELVDVMTGVDGTTITVTVSADDKIGAEVKTNSLKDGHIAADAAIAEAKLAQGVQSALALARTALQSHQDISGKKNVQTAIADQNLSGAKVVKGIAQDKQGVITVSTRDLTPADIGAQPAGNYKTEQTAVTKTGATTKTVTKIEQNKNGEITNVEFSDISYPDDTWRPIYVQYNSGESIPGGVWESTGKDGMRLDLDSSGDVELNHSSGGMDYMGFSFNVKDNVITTAKIVDNAITTVKIANKAITTTKIADHAVGAHQTKACQDYTGDDAEVWVFNCGSSTVNV